MIYVNIHYISQNMDHNYYKNQSIFTIQILLKYNTVEGGHFVTEGSTDICLRKAKYLNYIIIFMETSVTLK